MYKIISILVVCILPVSFNSYAAFQNCTPKVENDLVIVELLNGKGDVIYSKAHKTHVFLGYTNSISVDDATLQKLSANVGSNKVILSDKKKAKFLFKTIGEYTNAHQANGSTIARIGGCPTSSIKMILPRKKEDAPFVFAGFVQGKAAANQSNSPKGMATAATTSTAVITSETTNKATTAKPAPEKSNKTAEVQSGASNISAFGIPLSEVFSSSHVNKVISRGGLYEVEPKIKNQYIDRYKVLLDDNNRTEKVIAYSESRIKDPDAVFEKMKQSLTKKYGNPGRTSTNGWEFRKNQYRIRLDNNGRGVRLEYTDTALEKEQNMRIQKRISDRSGGKGADQGL